jgi:hypothetical protein
MPVAGNTKGKDCELALGSPELLPSLICPNGKHYYHGDAMTTITSPLRRSLYKPNENKGKSRSILELTCDEARAYFLEPDNYCSIDLPPYFQFDKLLCNVSKVLATKKLTDLQQQRPRGRYNQMLLMAK